MGISRSSSGAFLGPRKSTSLDSSHPNGGIFIPIPMYGFAICAAIFFLFPASPGLRTEFASFSTLVVRHSISRYLLHAVPLGSIGSPSSVLGQFGEFST